MHKFAKQIMDCVKAHVDGIGIENFEGQNLDDLKDWTEIAKNIGGGEESFGYLPYDKVRDKDAPASICLICEIAAWAKDNGRTLYDLLMEG